MCVCVCEYVYINRITITKLHNGIGNDPIGSCQPTKIPWANYGAGNYRMQWNEDREDKRLVIGTGIFWSLELSNGKLVEVCDARFSSFSSHNTPVLLFDGVALSIKYICGRKCHFRLHNLELRTIFIYLFIFLTEKDLLYFCCIV